MEGEVAVEVREMEREHGETSVRQSSSRESISAISRRISLVSCWKLRKYKSMPLHIDFVQRIFGIIWPDFTVFAIFRVYIYGTANANPRGAPRGVFADSKNVQRRFPICCSQYPLFG